ncbi:MAG: hypothetical protein JW791_05055 [Nanoarchaeota archaeon]|nr:hypothetical protein [Nanoarchaeota archaeon]
MRKTLHLIALIVLLAGCTGGGQEVDTTPAGGTLTMNVAIDDNLIEQGGSTSIDLSITNMFSNDIENIDIIMEPRTTGISYVVTGPDSVEDGVTEEWTIELSTSAGLNPRTYNLYPVICFDYTQEHIGYFRASRGTPSDGVDYTLSDTGPLDISFSGLSSLNSNEEQKMDVLVSFDLGNKISGGSSIYEDENELSFVSGQFKLDTVEQSLILKTNEGGANNYLNTGSDNNCVVQTGGDYMGYAVCYFTPSAGYDASKDFDFDIIVNRDLMSEIESSFSTEVTYRYCFRSTSTVTSITVEETN